MSRRPAIGYRKRAASNNLSHHTLQALGRVATLEQLFQDKQDCIKDRAAPKDVFDLWFITQKMGTNTSRLRQGSASKELRRELTKYLPPTIKGDRGIALRETELLRNLGSTSKAFFTISDLEKITGLERKSLYISLNRWVRRGVLERGGRNIYVMAGEPVRLEVIAEQSYFPCYLSFESALSRFGILNLVPYSLSFATTRKTRSVTLLNSGVDYRHRRQELYFGFTQEEESLCRRTRKGVARPYLLRLIREDVNSSDELDLRSLSTKTLQEYEAIPAAGDGSARTTAFVAARANPY